MSVSLSFCRPKNSDMCITCWWSAPSFPEEPNWSSLPLSYPLASLYYLTNPFVCLSLSYKEISSCSRFVRTKILMLNTYLPVIIICGFSSISLFSSNFICYVALLNSWKWVFILSSFFQIFGALNLKWGFSFFSFNSIHGW